ncbi:MAG: DUF2283 domain-containing protein [Thaumarchaeota archaeon]|nr:MAG: DUF2283 domain-containing protein [Nitrososphaerota archaeon]
MIDVHYDEKEDVLGIQLKNGSYWKSVEVSKNVVMDLSKEGEIIGIEILGVKEAFKKDAPLIVSKATRRKV